MELVFQEHKLEYWNRTICQSVTQEQTAELIVPDRQPDAERVVDACGTVLIRTVECAANAVSVAGSVSVGVLFVDSDGRIHRLQGQVPFSLRREVNSEEPERVLQARCTLCTVDARLLNSRKVLVRVSVRCELRVYSRSSASIFDLAEPSPSLQLRRKELPLRLPLAMGEKSFTLNEELVLPAGKPPIAELLKWVCRMQVLEQKPVGARQVFKGELTVHALYEDPDGELQSFESSLPFSQFADLGQECPDGEARTLLSLTSMEVEPDGQLECRRLLLSVGLLAQCMVMGEQRVAMIDDAYCTDAELTPKYADWSVCATLDRPGFRETAVATCDTPAQSVVDAWLYSDEPQRRREGQRVVLELPFHCNVLYRDAEGMLQGQTLHSALTLETALAEQGDCCVEQLTGGELYTSSGPNGIELRCPVSVELECFAEETLHAVCGGEILQDEGKTERRPAVVLRRTDGPEEIWQIAKATRSTVDSIMAVNELLNETVPAETLLLIPM